MLAGGCSGLTMPGSLCLNFSAVGAVSGGSAEMKEGDREQVAGECVRNEL